MLRRALVLIAVAACSLGCEGGTFTLEVTGDAVIRGGPLGELLNAIPAIGSFANLDFSQHQEFTSRGVTEDRIRSVRVESATLKILDPPEQDFSFLDELSFWAKVGDSEALMAAGEGLAELELPPPNPVLALEPSEEELKPFVTAPSMSIITRGRGRQPPEDTRIEATVVLRVELSLLR